MFYKGSVKIHFHKPIIDQKLPWIFQPFQGKLGQVNHVKISYDIKPEQNTHSMFEQKELSPLSVDFLTAQFDLEVNKQDFGK